MRSISLGRICSVLVLLATLQVLASNARAESGIVVVGGTAEERVRTTATTAIEKAVQDAGWSLATKKLSPKERDGLLACKQPTPSACVPPTLASAGIHQLVVVTIDTASSDDGSPMFVLVGRVIITNPQATQFNKRHCERCADDRLQSEATTLVAEMLRQLASQSGRTVVDIKSDPAGAQIVLDGQRIGITNSAFNTFPGKHVVILEKAGYLRETHEFVVEEGKTADVSLTLRASEVQTPETPPVTHRSRTVPGVVIGVGAAAAIGGVILYVVDEDQSPTGGKKYFDSAPAGVAIGIAGLVTVGAGAYLWRRASRSSSTPSANVVRGGAIIGWSGAF